MLTPVQKKKKARILYFISSAYATQEQIDFAEKHGLTIRNASAFDNSDALEVADGVFGAATPEAYSKKFKVIEIKDKEPLGFEELAAADAVAKAKAAEVADAAAKAKADEAAKKAAK